MNKAIAFFVAGIPAPQGSKRHVGNGVMVESSKKVKPWREDVRQAAERAATGRIFSGPVSMSLRFLLPAVSSDPYRTHHVTRPDLDKLVRSTLDAIVSAGVLHDDSHVFSLQASKFHCRGDERPGVHVELVDWTGVAADEREKAKARAAEARRMAKATS